MKRKLTLFLGAVVLAGLQATLILVQSGQDDRQGRVGPADARIAVRITSSPSRARVSIDWGSGTARDVLGTTPLLFCIDAALLERMKKARPTFTIERAGWVGGWRPDAPDYKFVRDRLIEMSPTLGPLSYVPLYPLFAMALGLAASAGWLAWRDFRAGMEALVDIAEIGPGSRVGQYRLVRGLGHGGTSDVFLGKSIEKSPRAVAVAVKVVHRDAAADESFRQRFEREVRIARRLRHRNIVEVLDHGSQNGRAFLVVEYVEGESLRDRLQRKPPLDVVRAVQITADVCDALDAAHGMGIVHRDLKPENILLTPEGLARLADFGVAHARDYTAMTATGAIVGTPAYMAPELLADSRAVAPAVDIYSLGCVLFEMLASPAPETVHDAQGADDEDAPTVRWNERRPALRSVREEVPPALDVLVSRMLERDPTMRPPTAADVKQTLSALLPLRASDS